MEEPVLRLTRKKYKAGSTVLSLRIPKDMTDEIDWVAEKTGRTRNEVMTLCLEFALEHMEIELDHNESDRNSEEKGSCQDL